MQTAEERLEDTWVPLDEKLAPTELEELIRAKEAHTNAAILESVRTIIDFLLFSCSCIFIYLIIPTIC